MDGWGSERPVTADQVIRDFEAMKFEGPDTERNVFLRMDTAWSSAAVRALIVEIRRLRGEKAHERS